MRLSTLSLLTFAASSSAIPDLIPGLFIPLKPPAYYTPLLYPLLFPQANYVGAFLGPLLKQAIGDETLELLDETADFFCVAAGDDPGKGGICQKALAALYQLGIAYTPAGQSAKFRMVLATLCIAPNTQPPVGTCQALLEMADCVANRILVVKEVECTGGGGEKTGGTTVVPGQEV